MALSIAINDSYNENFHLSVFLAFVLLVIILEWRRVNFYTLIQFILNTNRNLIFVIP